MRAENKMIKKILTILLVTLIFAACANKEIRQSPFGFYPAEQKDYGVVKKVLAARDFSKFSAEDKEALLKNLGNAFRQNASLLTYKWNMQMDVVASAQLKNKDQYEQAGAFIRPALQPVISTLTNVTLNNMLIRVQDGASYEAVKNNLLAIEQWMFECEAVNLTMMWHANTDIVSILSAVKTGPENVPFYNAAEPEINKIMKNIYGNIPGGSTAKDLFTVKVIERYTRVECIEKSKAEKIIWQNRDAAAKTVEKINALRAKNLN